MNTNTQTVKIGDTFELMHYMRPRKATLLQVRDEGTIVVRFEGETKETTLSGVGAKVERKQ